MAYGTRQVIQTVTVPSGGQASIEFTNIPDTYDDILFVISARTTGNVASEQWVFCQMNINAQGIGTNQSGRQVTGRASAESSTTTGVFYASSSASTANTFGNASIYFPNYRTSTNKSFSVDSVSEDNTATGAFLQMGSFLWSQTAAITSVAFTPRSGAGNFAQNSTATLYGITRVPSGAKATGGVIYDDASYWYHVFTSSGTFTPSQNLTCDYLVVAGGGGGGGNQLNIFDGGAGGGGAGGVRSTVTATGGGGSLESPLSLTANTNYTVTIGAGGAGANNDPGVNGSDSVFSTITSTGGGGGGAGNNVTAETPGKNGGSGGGAGTGGTPAPGTGTTNQGYAGGNSGGNLNGGGGGGAGAVGGNGGTNAGNGGAGVATSISGSSVTYGGGGGGGRYSNNAGTGGAGGGGNGGGNAGTANTGGGGGGASFQVTATGGNGGSGIVIVRYAK